MVVKIASYNPSKGAFNSNITFSEWADYKITARLNEPAESTITFADPQGELARLFGVRHDAMAGAVADDGGVEVDETAEANSAAAGDMTLLPAPFSFTNDAYYFGFSDASYNSLTLKVSQTGIVAPQTFIWEYSTGADSWSTLDDTSDGISDLFFNGGVARTEALQWNIPTDWSTDTVGAIPDVYWIRIRLTNNGADTRQALGTQAWAGSVYIGSGRITIENPAATDIWDGRIINVSFDQDSKIVQLHCQDWLSQLDDVIITKDMREDLDGNGMRESKARSDVDGPWVGPAENDAGTFYFYDDGEYDDAGGMGWAVDEFNGMKLVLAATMEGKKTWRFYPYQGSSTDADNSIAMDTGIEDVWVIDGNKHFCTDVVDYVTRYSFRIELGNNTPSDFYVHDSISGARLGVHYKIGDTSGNHCHAEIDDQGAGQISIGHMHLEDEYHTDVFELNKNTLDQIVANDGTLQVEFDCDRGGGGNLELYIDSVWIEVDVETEGYDSVIAIIDTLAPNKLEVGTDLTAAATQIWEAINYCIVRGVYEHIDSAETPGDLITDGSTGSGPDPLVVLTAAGTVEHTTSFSTRRYENATRLAIAKDLAEIDKVAFFVEIGTTTFTWKSTFNNGAPTAMTDATVLKWAGERSFFDVRNSYILYGPKQNDTLLKIDTADISPDPGVDSKALYGVTRSRTVNNKGVNNQYELIALGTALVERDEDALLFLSCEIAGLSSLRLGDEVSITSTYMGLTAEVYVITQWEFGWKENITKLRLHPRNSTKGFVPHRIFSDSIRRLSQETQTIERDVDYDAPEDGT